MLLAFLYQWRAALISLVAIPLSLMAAMLVLQWFGVTVNTMIVAGLAVALGAIIGDAVGDIENIMRRLRENRAAGTPRSPALVILDASLEIRSAVVYATLIIVLAVSPVFFMTGLSGAFFQPLAMAYVLALLASMVVALTITPALSLILLARAPLERQESPLVRWLQQAYARVLARVLRAPRTAFAATGALVLVGLALLPLLGQTLLPSFKERDFLMHWVTKPGTSYPEMSRITSEATQKLRAVPGVRAVGAHFGRAITSDTVVDLNTADIWVSIDPEADYDQTVTAIQAVADDYAGLNPDALSFATMKLNNTLTTPDGILAVRIFGPDLEVLHAKADEVRQALAGVEGIRTPQLEADVQQPGIEIEVNLSAAEGYGIKPGDVRRAATTLLAGIEVGSLFEEQKVFEVMVVGAPEIRSDLDSIRELLDRHAERQPCAAGRCRRRTPCRKPGGLPT